MNTIHETSVEHSNKRISSNNDNINLNKDGVNNNKNNESVTNEGAGEETKSGSLVVSDISNNNNDNDNNACGLTDNNDSKILSIVKNSVAQKIAPAQSTSRIARPCLGHQKPAVPLTPTKIRPPLESPLVVHLGDDEQNNLAKKTTTLNEYYEDVTDSVVNCYQG
ncbi:hypothetical protein FQA39_LY08612 [Lamprigera yunnana]|nr:hypothetical protein FQA39_LY08612 [Lamprigera yunnana]